MIANRRSILGYALGGMALAGSGALPVQAAGPILSSGLKARLTRILTRPLGIRDRLVVTRSWAIQFTPGAGGIVVSGMLTESHVDAPPALAALARIEQAREDSGPFPLQLDEQGLIRQASSATSEAALDQAIEQVERMLARGPRNGDASARTRLFMANLQQGGAQMLSQLPRDLLFPQSAGWQSERSIALPDGSAGLFRVSYSADPQECGPMLATAARRVLTTIGREERLSSEEWTLELSN